MLYSLILVVSITGGSHEYTIDYDMTKQDCQEAVDNRPNQDLKCVVQSKA